MKSLQLRDGIRARIAPAPRQDSAHVLDRRVTRGEHRADRGVVCRDVACRLWRTGPTIDAGRSRVDRTTTRSAPRIRKPVRVDLRQDLFCDGLDQSPLLELLLRRSSRRPLGIHQHGEEDSPDLLRCQSTPFDDDVAHHAPQFSCVRVERAIHALRKVANHAVLSTLQSTTVADHAWNEARPAHRLASTLPGVLPRILPRVLPCGSPRASPRASPHASPRAPPRALWSQVGEFYPDVLQSATAHIHAHGASLAPSLAPSLDDGAFTVELWPSLKADEDHLTTGRQHPPQQRACIVYATRQPVSQRVAVTLSLSLEKCVEGRVECHVDFRASTDQACARRVPIHRRGLERCQTGARHAGLRPHCAGGGGRRVRGRIKQRTHHVGVATVGGHDQRAHPVVRARDIRVRTLLEQLLNARGLTILRRDVQRRLAATLTGVDVTPLAGGTQQPPACGIEKQGHTVRVSLLARIEERGRALT
eukprot:scaffold73164_cov69-Phaeocystis_antarctica.AAC.2